MLTVPQSRNSPNFIEPKVSLPSSLELATCPYLPEPDESSQNFLSQFLRYILISWHLWLCLPGLLFRFPHQIPVCTSPPYVSHIENNLSFRDLVNQTMLGEEYRSGSSLLFSLLQFPVTSSQLRPTVFLSALFSNTLNLFSFQNVRSNLQNKYETVGRVTVQCTFAFFSSPYDKCIRQDAGLNGSKHSPYLICS